MGEVCCIYLKGEQHTLQGPLTVNGNSFYLSSLSN